ncbi:hypothetical protein DO021_05340 [Desulfobacter hydrogenophilus]|uniref:Flagellar protein FlgN n=1 Tax=Desulfobacter hydrogenophilus TaxID=2291 RepID=A0A328FJF8_9BACT|nr:hypothetical protein [Desulfobacter hydrogenophilus]NDY70950.1 hypothetical protein [Desulfobacter hydrogenophilus]QBH12808.1 hypothetical protein EYB58_07725 [Desulfobacter hydrogenophilus]RAM03045.1 hypothetical protein DO021_05340 [Desulfobacter hydrogenophilus]
MKDLSEQIAKQCSEYENLQNRHLDLLKAEPLPDLAQMTIERRGASEKLKSAINEFISTTGQFEFSYDAHKMATLKQRLGLILKVDGTIGVEIQRHKNQLEKSLKSLKHGKTTLESYRPAKGSPSLLSISR